MEVFKAKAKFFPREEWSEEPARVLAFDKGDLFEILALDEATTGTGGGTGGDREGEATKNWLGARALKDNNVGFVPANYMKKTDKSLESNLEDGDLPARQELHIQTLVELQKHANFKHPEQYYPVMTPDPDYSDSEDEPVSQELLDRRTKSESETVDGLIEPRKLSNPCMESKDHKELHKELLFNKKIGKNVLNQKSELKKVMDKFQDEHKKKELKEEQMTKRTSLDRKLEEQASKLKMQQEDTEETTKSELHQSEFLRVHAKVRARMDSQ